MCRLYEQLEEVKQRRAERSRQQASSQNRLKAKEFHQVSCWGRFWSPVLGPGSGARFRQRPRPDVALLSSENSPEASGQADAALDATLELNYLALNVLFKSV